MCDCDRILSDIIYPNKKILLTDAARGVPTRHNLLILNGKRGYPHPVLDGWMPIQSWMGVPRSSPWGAPPIMTWWGYPPIGTLIWVPPQSGLGGGTPLWTDIQTLFKLLPSLVLSWVVPCQISLR